MALPEVRPGSGADGFLKLYDMIDNFLNDLVQPHTVGEFIEDNNITKWSDVNSKDLLWDAQIYGFVTCILVGVSFTLIALLVYIVRFCCLCVCMLPCCGEENIYLTDSSRKKRFICGPLLFAMGAMMLSASICAFISNEYVHNEISTADEGIYADVLNGIDKIETFLDDSLDDINNTIIDDMQKTTETVFHILNDIPSDSIEYVGNQTGMTQLLNDLETFANKTEDLNSNLTVMVNMTDLLKNSTESLKLDLNSSQLSIEDLLNDCLNDSSIPDSIHVQCETALNQSSLLVSNLDYSFLGSDVSNALNITDEAIESGFVQMVQEAVKVFKDLVYKVENATSDDIDILESEVTEFQNNIINSFENITRKLDEIPFEKAEDKVNGFMNKYGETAADLFYYFVIILTSFALAIPVCYLCGIVFGELRPNPHFSRPVSCSSIHGARFLCAGVTISYMFTWVFMLFTVVTFITGGTTEIIACRHLVTYDETMQAIENVTKAELNVEYNASIRAILDDCKKDSSLYTALNFAENGFNITEIVDLEQYDIYDFIEELKNLTIEFPHVDIISDQLNRTLLELDFALKQIDFNAYTEQLQKPITETDLVIYAESLEVISQGIGVNTTLGNDLQNEADTLRYIQGNSYSNVEHQSTELNISMLYTEEIVTSADLGQLLDNLTEAESVLNSEGDELVNDIIVDQSNRVIKELERFSAYIDDAVRNDIGQCRILYDACAEVVYGPCVYFLNPFNALWFCYGWFIFFCLPAGIIASCLRTVYKKYQPLGETHSFETVNTSTLNTKKSSTNHQSKSVESKTKPLVYTTKNVSVTKKPPLPATTSSNKEKAKSKPYELPSPQTDYSQVKHSTIRLPHIIPSKNGYCGTPRKAQFTYDNPVYDNYIQIPSPDYYPMSFKIPAGGVAVMPKVEHVNEDIILQTRKPLNSYDKSRPGSRSSGSFADDFAMT